MYMKILSVHNEYLIKGGEDQSRRAETLVLEKYGEEVTYYTEHNSKVAELSKIASALRTIWSRQSYNKITEILKNSKHDIMHVQNFFPLISPSIYYAAKKQKVPIVQAVRNYRLICPAYSLYRDGHICTDCVGHTVPLPVVIHKCYRHDVSASAAVAGMLTIHNIANTWNLVDRFICISEFVKQQLINGGYPESKLIVKPNFVFPDPGEALVKENYFVFVGRLQTEKGLHNLLEAMSMLKDGFKLKIIGTGPLLNGVLEIARVNPNIEYMGELSLEKTYEIIGKAKFLIIPSVWHEPFGRVVVEAYAKGTPVIGADVGGIPELIKHEQTGLIFKSNDCTDLAAKINWMYEHESRLPMMNKAARNEFLDKYTPEINYHMMKSIYEKIISS